MKEFKSGYKFNFVDTNDVLVGFDSEPSCCEHFGWFYSYVVPTQMTYDTNRPADLESYVFDPEFFHETGDGDAGIAAFKLVADGKQDIYLCLFNSHNGYYSHGFTCSVKGEVIREGSL